MKICLLGDSVFDNATYVKPTGLSVVEHLSDVTGHLAALKARDGAICCHVALQVAHVPRDATHLAVSMGGNDLLQVQDQLMNTRVQHTGEALEVIGEIVLDFERNYRFAVDRVFALKLPTVLCTIYNGNLPKPMGSIGRVAVAMFDEVIMRYSRYHGARLIDLRDVCTQPEDYANQIEPSHVGGLKIAKAIAMSLTSER